MRRWTYIMRYRQNVLIKVHYVRQTYFLVKFQYFLKDYFTTFVMGQRAFTIKISRLLRPLASLPQPINKNHRLFEKYPNLTNKQGKFAKSSYTQYGKKIGNIRYIRNVCLCVRYVNQMKKFGIYQMKTDIKCLLNVKTCHYNIRHLIFGGERGQIIRRIKSKEMKQNF